MQLKRMLQRTKTFNYINANEGKNIFYLMIFSLSVLNLSPKIRFFDKKTDEL